MSQVEEKCAIVRKSMSQVPAQCVWVEEKFVIVANVAKEKKLFFSLYSTNKRHVFVMGGQKRLEKSKIIFRGTPPLRICPFVTSNSLFQKPYRCFAQTLHVSLVL